MLWNRYLYQCFALAFSYICLSDWISIVNGLFTVVYCVYIVLLNFLKFLLKSAEPTHPHSGTKTIFIACLAVSFKNQPIPTRGRKPSCNVVLIRHLWNQPIPTRGRKYNIPVNVAIIGKNQPIPKRGRKWISYASRPVLYENEPTHPHSGTKI